VIRWVTPAVRGVSVRARVILPAALRGTAPFDYIIGALCEQFAEFACILKFGGVLVKCGAKRRADVTMADAAFTQESGPTRKYGSKQEMIALVSATCVAEIMHDGPSMKFSGGVRQAS